MGDWGSGPGWGSMTDLSWLADACAFQCGMDPRAYLKSNSSNEFGPRAAVEGVAVCRMTGPGSGEAGGEHNPREEDSPQEGGNWPAEGSCLVEDNVPEDIDYSAT